MRSRLRVILGLGALALIVAALVYVTFRTDPVPVDLQEVATAPMRVTIDADGQTRVRDLYQVAAPIAGTALRSPVEVGDAVVAGQTVVARVEPGAPALLDARSRIQAEAAVREAEAALHVAESDLRKTEEDVAYAQSQYDRTQQLTERGTVSITRLEDAAQRLAVAQAARDAAQSRLAMASGALQRAEAALIEPDMEEGTGGPCCVEITAPADGVVLDIAEISERPVAAGAPLLTIGDPADLQIVADLLSSDAVRIGPGTPAVVERWGGPGTLDAELVRIEPAARTKVSALGIEEQRVDAIFDLVSPLEERPGLGHNFAVFLRIVEWQADDVLQVPLSAVFREGGGYAVFVAEDGAARLRPVTLGRRNMRTAEIRDGLAPGDRVIVHPNEQIADGTAVTLREAS